MGKALNAHGLHAGPPPAAAGAVVSISPPASPADLEALAELFSAWPQRPYRQYRGLAPEVALARLAGIRLRRLVNNPDSSVLVARQGAQPAGAGAWTRLAWDSEQFGIPAGRIEFLLGEGNYAAARHTKALLLDALLADANSRGIRHLIARVDAGDLSGIHVLESAGFETIDGIQTFSLRLDGPLEALSPDGLEVRQFRQEDLEEVLGIARTAYVYDRFHADAALSGETADAINETWVRNSCLGKAADAVVVACEDGRVVAYVTCKLDAESAEVLGVSFGAIVMVATSGAARRRGAAKAATQGALDWFRSRGVDVVEVGTQLRNIAAGRLYEQCGFRLSAVSLTLRKLL